MKYIVAVSFTKTKKMTFDKKSLKDKIESQTRLIYYWNGCPNSITGVLKKCWKNVIVKYENKL